MFCYQTIFGATYILVHVSTGTFFLAIGMFFEACAQHFQTIFADIGNAATEKPTIQLRHGMKASLAKAIQFHNDVKWYTHSPQPAAPLFSEFLILEIFDTAFLT